MGREGAAFSFFPPRHHSSCLLLSLLPHYLGAWNRLSEECFLNRPFPSSRGPLFQNEGSCSAFDMEIIFHSHADKAHFHKKGFCTWPHFESEGFWNSEVANYTSGQNGCGSSSFRSRLGDLCISTRRRIPTRSLITYSTPGLQTYI